MERDWWLNDNVKKIKFFYFVENNLPTKSPAIEAELVVFIPIGSMFVEPTKGEKFFRFLFLNKPTN